METGLALAKFHLGQLEGPDREAKRLAELRDPNHRLLAEIWLAIDDHEQAGIEAGLATERRQREALTRAAAMAPGGAAVWIGAPVS